MEVATCLIKTTITLYTKTVNTPPASAGQPTQHPRRRPRKKRGSTGNTIIKVLGTLFLVGLCTGAVLCCFGAYYVQTVILPEVEVSMDDFQLGENSVMYYQDKETGRYVEMTTLLSSTSSVWVDLEEMPKYLPQAAVAIEDQRFYTHPGWTGSGRPKLFWICSWATTFPAALPSPSNSSKT